MQLLSLSERSWNERVEYMGAQHLGHFQNMKKPLTHMH